MSEVLPVLINQPDEFDRAVHGDDQLRALRECGDLRLITKDDAMVSGRAGAVFAFTVELDGRLFRAQATVPVRLLKLALRIVESGYDDDGMPRPGTWGR